MAMAETKVVLYCSADIRRLTGISITVKSFYTRIIADEVMNQPHVPKGSGGKGTEKEIGKRKAAGRSEGQQVQQCFRNSIIGYTEMCVSDGGPSHSLQSLWLG
jgi:hypothetical protein